MNFKQIIPENFFSTFFSNFGVAESLLILFFLFVSFIIGLLAGWMAMHQKSNKVRAEVKTKTQEKEDLMQVVSGMKEEMELREADFKRTRLEVQKLQTEKAATTTRISELTQREESLVDELKTLKSRITADTNLIEDLRNQLLGLKTKFEQLSSETSQESGHYPPENLEELNRLRDENHSLKAMLEKENSSKNNELASLMTGMEEKLKKIEKGNYHLVNLTEKINRLEKENSSLRSVAMKVQKLENEQQTMQKLLKEINSLRQPAEEFPTAK